MTKIFTILALGLALPMSTVAHAQSAAKADKEVLITLGTAGGPIPQPERAGIATLLQVNGRSYLFDAGVGVAHRLAGARVNPADVRQIFLTHLHDDHYSGLTGLMGQSWILKPMQQVDLYGPPMTKDVVDSAIAHQSVSVQIRSTEQKLPPKIENFVAHEIKPGEIYKDENIKVTAVENSHFHFRPGTLVAGRTISLSYRVETPNRVIVITGDTGPFNGFGDFARDADLLVTEVLDPDEILKFIQASVKEKLSDEAVAKIKFHMEQEHMTPESIAKLASEAKVKSVVMTHLPARRGGDQAFGDFVARVKAGYSGKVVVATDLDRF